jgi:lipopolysaccharide transport protein LptA
MLKQDQPVNVTANRLEYDGASALATYTGNARLFQDQTSVQGDAIIVDDRNGNLTARGNVRSVMFFEEEDSTTKTRSLAQRTATGDVMVYEDAKRLATYTTGPTAKAHIVGSEGDVTGDRIQLFLKKDVNELERAEADGNVVVKEGMRTAIGVHLTYTPADDTYVMTGSPVEIEEKTPTECRVTIASKVTFKKAAVSTRIENNGLTPVTTRPCSAKS